MYIQQTKTDNGKSGKALYQTQDSFSDIQVNPVQATTVQEDFVQRLAPDDDRSVHQSSQSIDMDITEQIQNLLKATQHSAMPIKKNKCKYIAS